MAAQQIFPKQTAAITIPKLVTISQEQLPATLIGDGLSGADTIPINVTIDDGITSFAASEDGTPVALTVGNNAIAINSPMTLFLTKPLTTGVAGVFIAAVTEI